MTISKIADSCKALCIKFGEWYHSFALSSKKMQWRIEMGAQQAHASSKCWSTMIFFLLQFYIRMLQNKSQIAWESIENLRASSAYKRALWTPVELERFRASRSSCALDIFWAPSISTSWIRPWSAFLLLGHHVYKMIHD